MKKIGAIGIGGIFKNHYPGWEKTPDAEVVAVADVNPQVLADWGRENPDHKTYDDYRDLLANPEIDAVDICVPNMLHKPFVIAALEAGKHVLCEKPLAPTPSEIREIIAARDRSGRQLMTAQNIRFSETSQRMRAEIADGEIGNVYHARAWMLRRNAFIPTPTFVHKDLAGGGAAIDIGVHVLDLTLWLMGSPRPTSVSGVSRTELAHQPGQFSIWRPDMEVPTTWDVEEQAAAFIRFDNGATLMLEVSWLLHHDTDSEDMQVWLYGDRGGAHWPSAKFLSSDFQEKKTNERTLEITNGSVGPGTHEHEVIAFASAIANGEAVPVPPEQSLSVMSILDGIYESQRLGGEIRLDS